jgi:hypothetical protein
MSLQLREMKSSLLRKHISRSELFGYSTRLAGSALLTHFFPPGYSALQPRGYTQPAPSAADLLATPASLGGHSIYIKPYS